MIAGMDAVRLIRELADRFRAIVPDGFRVNIGYDAIVWFSCDEGRFPGQQGKLQPGVAGTQLRHMGR